MQALRRRIGGVAAALAAVLLTAHGAIHPGLQVHRHAGGDHTHIHPDDLDPADERTAPEPREQGHAHARHAASTDGPTWREPGHRDASTHWHARSPLHPAVASVVTLTGTQVAARVTDATDRGAAERPRLPVRVRGPPALPPSA